MSKTYKQRLAILMPSLEGGRRMKPTPKQIKEARFKACIPQTKAAVIIGVHLSTWKRWEAGKTAMNPAAYELFILKTKQKEA